MKIDPIALRMAQEQLKRDMAGQKQRLSWLSPGPKFRLRGERSPGYHDMRAIRARNGVGRPAGANA